MDALCDWVNLNWTNVRHQDALSLILCLAAVDFLPSSWEPLWEKMSHLLKEGNLTSSMSKLVYLDLVWSLAVLNHLEPVICQAVLTDEFIHEVLGNNIISPHKIDCFCNLLYPGLSAPNSKGAQLKLNQIWATAVLKKWDLSGIYTRHF